MDMPKFPLGRLVATPGAIAELERLQMDALILVRRHHRGDWGDLDEHDRQANAAALIHGDRLLSAYHIHRPPNTTVKFWIITEADRSVTTVLLPEEY